MLKSYTYYGILVCLSVLLVNCRKQADTNKVSEFEMFDQKTKTFEFTDRFSNEKWLTDSKVVFYCNGVSYSVDDLPLEGMYTETVESTFGKGLKNRCVFSAGENLRLGVEVITYDTTNWISVNGWVENTGKEVLVFDRARLLDAAGGFLLGGDTDNWRVLEGSSEQLSWIGKSREAGKKALTGRSVMALFSEDTGMEAVLGFSIKHAWGSVSVHTEKNKPHLTADVHLDVDVKPGQRVYAEALHMKKGPVVHNMSELIAATGREVNAVTDGESFGGWCSWYGFNPFIDNDITEDAVLEFASEAGKFQNELPLQVMLLDDGYFTLPGDWITLRPTFPNGMKYLTDQVSEQGLIPGIWVAVSLVHENAEAMRLHPEWVDLDSEGKPHHEQFNWGGRTHSFDVSNPEVLSYIDSLFRVITEEWGFRYLKLDFNIEPGSNRKDRSITSFTAMRNMYKTIHHAVGENVFLANCAGSPYSPSIGYAKAGRVGPDVNPNWESVLEGCRRSLLHILFHRRWWVNDPDCLNMREYGSQLSDAELQTHLTANFMGGGYVMFSDSLARLSPERRRMLAQALPSSGYAADVLDYMTAPEEGIPSLFNMLFDRFGEEYAITTVFNWSEDDRSRILDMKKLGLDSSKEYHIYDFWTNTYKGIHKGVFHIEGQSPHSCLLLAIRPVMKDHIQIISTDLHLLQGTMEISNITRMNTSPFDAAKDEIWIEITPVSLRNGKVILAAPDGLRIASLQGCKGRLEKREDGLWNLYLENLQEKSSVVMRVR